MAKLHPYHPALTEMLQAQPPRGHGHRWLFRFALHFRHYHTEEACYRLLRACANEWHDRAVPDAEIRSAVRNAYALPADEARVASHPWPDPSPAAIARVLASTTTVVGLIPLDLPVSRILPILFDCDELVCAGYSQGQGCTATLQEILPNLARYQFVVPSPMTTRTATNDKGEQSFRCLRNAGLRRYLVIEGDATTKEEQSKILTHLSGFLPLALAVDSGGKSLHGWFWAQGVPEPTLRVFMEYAVHLGADPHTWVRCQWVRMPGGTRYTDGVATGPQPIVYVHDDLLAEVF